MNLKQKVESNPLVWLASTLIAGFVAGFAAYQTILEVSGRVTVASEDYESGKNAIESLSVLEEELKELKTKVGAAPDGLRLVVTSRLDGNNPTDSLTSVKLDESFWIATRWIGVLGKRYYEQKWEISDRDGVVATHWHPFIPKEDGSYRTWAHFNLSSTENTPGNYRIRVFINDDQPFESKQILVIEE